MSSVLSSGSSADYDDAAAGTGKLAARVARQIEQDVQRAGWPIGQLLGSENELRARYQVSRSVLREAIRLVEHHRVASTRRGPGGGLVVRVPDADGAASAMAVYLEFVSTTLEHLLTARRIIEPLAAALAARNITEDGITTLRTALNDELACGPHRDSHIRSALHPILGKLSGNPALHVFSDVLVRLTFRYALDQLSHLPDDPSHPVLTSSDFSHEAIVDAVVSADASRAHWRMAQHLRHWGDWLLEWRPHSRFPPTAFSRLPSPGHTREHRLAADVAQRLLSEIIAGGWAVGSVVGTEAAFLERFEVSRAVFREAVRLLEYYSVAEMRRGPSGGLVVGEPDPSASVAAVTLYLDYEGIAVEHLCPVREAIEVACLDLIADRVANPDVARRLRVLRDTNSSTGRDLSQLHMTLAELAGNPVLALFLRILIALSAGDPTPDTAASLTQVHHDIIDAVVIGDRSLARHRMSRHLSGPSEWWR